MSSPPSQPVKDAQIEGGFPEMSPGQRVAIEAWKRGIQLQVIAHGLGISFQAVQDKIKRYEARTGKKIERRSPRRSPQPKFGPLTGWICKHCGRPGVTNGRRVPQFCSRKCSGEAQRTISDETVIRAIQMRVGGQTWTGIVKLFGLSGQQPLQRRIWTLLSERGLLTRPTVSAIWRPASSLHRESCSWEYLVNKTGIRPLEDFSGRAVFPYETFPRPTKRAPTP